MYVIEHSPAGVGNDRLFSPDQLTSADFDAIAVELGVVPQRAKKHAYIAARQASAEEAVTTFVSGKETSNTASIGDWIATSLTADHEVLRVEAGGHNSYVIRANVFDGLYEPAGGENECGRFFKSRGIVDAIFLSSGFDIMTPWGKRQTAEAGYLIRNGPEIYGTAQATFDETYRMIG